MDNLNPFILSLENFISPSIPSQPVSQKAEVNSIDPSNGTYSRIISKRKKSEIELDLVNIAGIIKKDDSYDYLLNMNLLSLTEERMQKLESDIRTNKEKLDSLKIKDVKDIWKEEI
jgi:hypothetical protein